MENTTDFSKFGQREIKKAGELLTAYSENNMTKRAQDRFSGNGVQVMFNPNSGNVFLTNEDYDVLMFNGEELDLFLSTPYDGHEGFFDELMEQYEELHQEDKDFLDQFKD